MKKILLILLIISTTLAFSQSTKNSQKSSTSLYDIPYFEIDSASQLVIYSDVIKVDNATKDSLYVYGQRWIKKQFKSVTSVMQIQDPEKGILEGRHSFYVNKEVNEMQTKGDLIKYTFTLLFRDGRFKYTITKINVQKSSYYGIENWLNDDEKLADELVESYLNQIDEFMQAFVLSIEEGIKPLPAKKADEW